MKEKNKLPQEYHDFVKASVEDGSYFKDARNWYFLRYINPICDRTLLGFSGIVAAFTLYFLIQIISSAFPLVEQVPIVIRDHDASIYRPIIHELKEEQKVGENLTVDELAAKYLLSNYVASRESYDFRESNVQDVNQMFNRIKNTSSYAEYKNFQSFMSRENVDSPLNNFGRNIYRTTTIDDVKFIKKQQKGYDKIKALFANQIPKEAEIRFTNATHTIDENGLWQENSEKFLVKINFKFAGLDRDAKSGVLDFAVNEYQLFKIK